MFASRLTKLPGTAIVTAGLGLAAAFAGTATAAATSTRIATAAATATSADDAFLADITGNGIGYDSPAAAINAGHEVRSLLRQGHSPELIAEEIAAETNLTVDQADYFVESAAIFYC